MPVTPMFTPQSIADYINEQAAIQRKAIVEIMVYIGKQCVNTARSLDTYKDQTGNLRSSIGFIVVDGGQVVFSSGFPVIKTGSEGAKTGRDFIKELAQENSTGISLIVVAGMNYASYVEAMGFNVLTSAELLAEQKVPEMLRKLGFEL